MTRERDIERVLDAWLEPGPTQMPDRLFDDVLARVDRLPQRRIPLTLRFPPMNSRIRWLALAAAALVVAVAGLSLINRPDGNVGASPTPSASPEPSILASLPAELRHVWIGETREIPGLNPPASLSILKLYASGLEFEPGGNTILNASASLDSQDVVRFVASLDSAGCKLGDVGSYAFTLSPSGRALSLTLVSDACSVRTAAISGDWAKVDCASQNPCLGDLDAGTHKSSQFNPFTPLTSWVYDYGRLEYTVPDGWSNIEDGASGFTLAKQQAPEGAAIFVFQTAQAESQADGCPGTAEPSVGQTASALSTWLTTLPGLNTTAPAPVTIGGLSGFTLDVSVDPAWTRTCSFTNGVPYVPMFTNGLYTEGTNFDWGLGGDARMRLFLLDLPDGRTTLIDIEAHDKATWDALVDDASAVVETFQFNP